MPAMPAMPAMLFPHEQPWIPRFFDLFCCHQVPVKAEAKKTSVPEARWHFRCDVGLCYGSLRPRWRKNQEEALFGAEWLNIHICSYHISIHQVQIRIIIYINILIILICMCTNVIWVFCMYDVGLMALKNSNWGSKAGSFRQREGGGS